MGNVKQIMYKVNDNLRALRDIIGLRQSELAEKLGMSKQAYWNCENGKSKLTLKQYGILMGILEQNAYREDIKMFFKDIVDYLKREECNDEEDAAYKFSIQKFAEIARTGFKWSEFDITQEQYEKEVDECVKAAMNTLKGTDSQWRPRALAKNEKLVALPHILVNYYGNATEEIENMSRYVIYFIWKFMFEYWNLSWKAITSYTLDQLPDILYQISKCQKDIFKHAPIPNGMQVEDIKEDPDASIKKNMHPIFQQLLFDLAINYIEIDEYVRENLL